MIGIVASRLSAIFPPAIVISVSDGIGIGSGDPFQRGPHGAVSKISDHLNDFGGHKMAIGLNINEDRISALARDLDSVLAVPLGLTKASRST